MDTPTITTSVYGAAMAGHGANHLDQLRDGFLQQQAARLGVANRVLQPQQGIAIVSNTRIVKIYIADTNENLPVKQRVLYQSDEILTDSTDQELYFSLPIQDLLTKHNELRAKTLDKKQSDRMGKEVFLDPIRVRDLRMSVVVIAQF